MADLQNPGIIWGNPPPTPPGATGATGATGAIGATGTATSNYYQQYSQPVPPPPTPGTGDHLYDAFFGAAQKYADASYNNQASRLDPQWQQQQNAFDQRMVSQGLMPGSEAYNNAYTNFTSSKNDAYNQARNTAMQQGLGAQNQAYQQQFGYDQLANALAIANSNMAGTMGAASIGANASMHNNDANNATNQLLGLGNLGLGYGNLQNQTNGQDFSQLMQLMGYGNGLDQYNNQLVGGAQNTLLGLIPNGSPSPVDVTGAYGLNQSGQNAQYQGQVANANSTNQMVGTAGSLVMMAVMM
jgi:hypothetical protein